MTRMCSSLLILKEGKQDGHGHESGDKGMGNGRAGYRKRVALPPRPRPCVLFRLNLNDIQANQSAI